MELTYQFNIEMQTKLTKQIIHMSQINQYLSSIHIKIKKG
jgi:hypothetical protein